MEQTRVRSQINSRKVKPITLNGDYLQDVTRTFNISDQLSINCLFNLLRQFSFDVRHRTVHMSLGPVNQSDNQTDSVNGEHLR